MLPIGIANNPLSPSERILRCDAARATTPVTSIALRSQVKRPRTVGTWFHHDAHFAYCRIALQAWRIKAQPVDAALGIPIEDVLIRQPGFPPERVARITRKP